jgi:transposase
MAKPLEISRKELCAAALRETAAATGDGAVVRRLLAIAMALEGHSREESARLNCMQRQTLRDWVNRYNQEGVAGLRSRHRSGRPPALTEDQMKELENLVLEGPDLERHGVVRWRCGDLRKEGRAPGGGVGAVGKWPAGATAKSLAEAGHLSTAAVIADLR